jgi:hypothetical protein
MSANALWAAVVRVANSQVHTPYKPSFSKNDLTRRGLRLRSNKAKVFGEQFKWLSPRADTNAMIALSEQ